MYIWKSSYAFGLYLFIAQVLVKLVTPTTGYFVGPLLGLFVGIVYGYLRSGISSIKEKVTIVSVYLALNILLGLPQLFQQWSTGGGSSSPVLFAGTFAVVMIVYGLITYAFISWGERVQMQNANRALKK